MHFFKFKLNLMIIYLYLMQKIIINRLDESKSFYFQKIIWEYFKLFNLFKKKQYIKI